MIREVIVVGGPISMFQKFDRCFSGSRAGTGGDRLFHMDKLAGSELRKLKGMAQVLEPVLKVGRNGVSREFLDGLETELDRRELIKVKFSAFKDQKQALAAEIAERTGSHLVTRVGNVAVFFRPNPDLQRIKL